jgi:CubicO group peptidase (beta-lactamase class C family)
MTHYLMQDHADLATAIDLLDKWIQRTMHKNHQPGLAAGIVYDGILLWGKGYGFADTAQQKPVTLDTRFRIASITKTFTATAILKLRDEGKLQLDDPVQQYVPWFSQRYLDAPLPTIRNLLTHTSGLPRDATSAMWTDAKGVPTDEYLAETKLRELTQPPNHKFAYSNLGYSLLGNIIEAITGISWSDYVQQNILDPLGMNATYPIPKSEDSDLATGYTPYNETYVRSTAPFMDMGGFAPSANFASNINDLVRYARFHLSKGYTPVLSGHTLRDMHRVHWLYENWQGGYGLGVSLFRVNDWTISGHSGGYPGYLTDFRLCRDHNFGAIILTNTVDSNPSQYVEQCYKLVLPEVIKATAKGQAEAEAAWQAYVGTYVSDGEVFEVVIRNNQLQVISLENIHEKPAILQPTDKPHTFMIEETNQSNEAARFEYDADGKLVKLWYRNEYAVPKR